MKQIYLIILIILLSISAFLFGQELNINKEFADSIQNRNWNLGKELNSIILYNQVVKSFGYTDTIRIFITENNYNYFYRDSLITDLRNRNSNEQRLIMIDYSASTDFTYLVSKTQQSLTSQFELVVLVASFDPNDLVYRLSNFSNDVQIGRYEERTKSGKVLVSGHYCQIDSMYSDTLLYIDPETYEDIFEIKPRSKFPIKSGIWRYYTPKGVLSKEEKHKNCT